MNVHLQKGWLDPGEHRVGIVINTKPHERYPTIDICWWWGWVMVYFSR